MPRFTTETLRHREGPRATPCFSLCLCASVVNLFGIVFFICSTCPATEIQYLTQNTNTVGRYDLLEVTFQLSRIYENPFDPDQVDARVTFRGPNGYEKSVPAFYYMDCDAISSDTERYSAPYSACWKARFAPAAPGAYTYGISVADSAGTARLDPASGFICIESGLKGFIRVDARDSRLMRYDDGSPYLPIGQNLAWGRGEGTAWWRDRLTQMSSHGENWARIWMTHFFDGFTIEWSRQHERGYWEGLGRYSMQMAWLIDRVIEMARSQGIGVQLVLQHHGQFSISHNPNWDLNPFNAIHGGDGGFLQQPQDFFTNEKARQLVKRKLRYIVARWGYATSVMAWELFNEVELTDDYGSSETQRAAVAEWHREMSDYLRGADAFGHLITTSADSKGFDAIWSQSNIDTVQVHHYGANKIDAMVSAASRLSRQEKTIIVGEFGSEGSAEDRLDNLSEPEKSQMIEGLDLHNALWAASHSKSSAMPWYWEYIQAYNLYDAFQPLSDYWAGEDPAAHQLSKADLITTGGPAMQGLTLSPGSSDFESTSPRTVFNVSAKGAAPGIRRLSQYVHGRFHEGQRSDPEFNIDLATTGDLKIHATQASSYATNTLRVLLDSEEVFRSQGYSGDYNFVTTVSLPSGRHSIKIENTGPDWFQISGYEFTGFGVNALSAVGMAGPERAYLWLYDLGSQYKRTANGSFAGVQVGLNKMRDGEYIIEFWATRSPGGRIGQTRVRAEGGRLLFELPEFEKDLAVKVFLAKVSFF
ncbi:MAG: DUF5060 domain-containing protein [Candidatus Sumerlaeota bacterium]|nr:DUF5060 domain-containing protein [Candidatus Sumerlaeota bacterium]